MLGYEKRIQEEIKELESLCKNIPVEFIKLRIQDNGKVVYKKMHIEIRLDFICSVTLA